MAGRANNPCLHNHRWKSISINCRNVLTKPYFRVWLEKRPSKSTLNELPKFTNSQKRRSRRPNVDTWSAVHTLKILKSLLPTPVTHASIVTCHPVVRPAVEWHACREDRGHDHACDRFSVSVSSSHPSTTSMALATDSMETAGVASACTPRMMSQVAKLVVGAALQEMVR
jgi:hypothetical protein